MRSVIRGFGVVCSRTHVARGYRPGAATSKQDSAKGDEARLKGGYRFERGGWVYVHLEGAPADIGYQHGYLLAPEIEEGLRIVQFKDVRRTKRDWGFYRATAQNILWPHIDEEYQQELQGIADGLKARGSSWTCGTWSRSTRWKRSRITTFPMLDKQEKQRQRSRSESARQLQRVCRDGVLDQRPQAGDRAQQLDRQRDRQALDDDLRHRAHAWLSHADRRLSGNHRQRRRFRHQLRGNDGDGDDHCRILWFDPNGKPEFVRARKAAQYANSIDQYVEIMLEGNNGGYANDWLLADNKTGEIARFEDGLKIHRVWRTKNGYFEGANFPSDPELIKTETDFDPTNMSSSPNARRVRWQQLLPANKGQIDLAMGEKFLADHYDTYEGKEDRNYRGLCGHADTSPAAEPRGTILRTIPWAP